jgi:hypothetical protein
MPRLQVNYQDARFCTCKAVNKDPDKYVLVDVAVERVLESWKDSILSFEFLTPDGSLREDRELSPKNRDRRLEVETKIREGKPVDHPVLGIGLMDNVEIGSGRDVFMTLALQGHTTAPVHIRIAQQDDFKGYIV